MAGTTIDRAQYAALAAKPKRRKYRNQPVVVDGIRFDSKAEAKRWGELQELQSYGVIRELSRQNRYELRAEPGVVVGHYVSDFDYFDIYKQRYVTEDTKGVQTPLFKFKAKIFEANYGRKITITGAPSSEEPVKW